MYVRRAMALCVRVRGACVLGRIIARRVLLGGFRNLDRNVDNYRLRMILAAGRLCSPGRC
jgi:hypothetical protein